MKTKKKNNKPDITRQNGAYTGPNIAFLTGWSDMPRVADSTVETLIRRKLYGILDEVSLSDAIGGLTLRYHYVVDPDKKPTQKGDKWFVNDAGHSVFIYKDPELGMRWQHYQKPVGKNRSVFQKGFGVATLDAALESIHTKK